LKQEVGLDPFEGISWQGLHRHALMTKIAYAFLQYRRLKTARREKRFNGPPSPLTLPAVRQAILELNYRSTTAAAMPPLQKMDLQRNAA
jgi:SRSO17 transposase